MESHSVTRKALRPVGSNFRQLVIWQKSQDLAVAVADVVASLPSDPAARVIANQVLRAATSIAANIAEGYGRYSQAAYRNHVSIARGSAFEVESWLDLLSRRAYISEEQASRLIGQVIEVQRLLTLKMKSLDGQKSYAVREGELPYDV